MKKYLLPAIAAVLLIAAVVTVLLVPKRGRDNQYVEFDSAGNIVIRGDTLTEGRVEFLQLSDESSIELLARRGADGSAKVALGTCQSCQGSPGAYYTQEGDQLKCNNCGLTFPLKVLDEPGGGCHPIMIDPGAIEYQGNDILLDPERIYAYEPLFATVEGH